MTKVQWEEMTEFLKEDVSTVTDYLEVAYDELEASDFALFYEAVTGERAEQEEKEALHRALLEVLYDLAEENEKEFKNALKRVEKVIIQK